MSEKFHKAARDGVIDILKETTKRDCNSKDEDGMTPTLWAAFSGNLEALRILVARGGDPDKSDNFGNTTLHHAAERGHISCVRFLTNFGSNLWSLNCQMHTPKELAAMNNKTEILRFLDEAMAEQEAKKRREVKSKKEKAQKDVEKKLKEYEKIQKKAEKYAEKEQKRLEKEREKMGEKPSTVIQVLKNKTGVGGGISLSGNSSSPKFSEIVGTMTDANAKKFGIGAVHKKLQPKKSCRNRRWKKSVKNLTGLRRDSEILYVGTYDKEKPNAGMRGKLSDVFIKKEGPDAVPLKKNEPSCENVQEQSSIFERPGFGSYAFRNSVTTTLNALTVPAEEDEVKGNKCEESSIGSAGSLVKRHHTANELRSRLDERTWIGDRPKGEDCDIADVEDVDSLEDDETSPLQLFLVSNGLSEYLEKFVAEKIDLESLLILTDEDLISLGLPMGPRRKLMVAVNNRKKALQHPGQVLDSQL